MSRFFSGSSSACAAGTGVPVSIAAPGHARNFSERPQVARPHTRPMNGGRHHFRERDYGREKEDRHRPSGKSKAQDRQATGITRNGEGVGAHTPQTGAATPALRAVS